MPDSEEKLDEQEAIERLNAALTLQYRSALQYSIAAASLAGIEAQALGAKLTGFGDEELSDAHRLTEPTERERRSEVLEHLILGKPHQIDFLRRAIS